MFTNRLHVWFFLFCYAISALGITVVSNPFWIAVYIWTILTPMLLGFSWFSYREGR